MNIDDLTIAQIKDLRKILNVEDNNKNNPYIIGKKYFIRTVTMNILGKLKEVYEHELILEKASWIADCGRFHNFLKDEISSNAEIEPFVKDVIIGRDALIDATEWDYELPGNQK